MFWGIKKLPIGIDVDVRPIISQMKREFADLSGSEVNKATARALNEMIGKAKVQASREIRGTYKVKAKYIKDQIKPEKATRAKLTANLRVNIRPMPLIAFEPRQTKKGVTINIMGKRKLIPSAFIATMKSGHTGVFARGQYIGQEFSFRKVRKAPKGHDLPIDELVTASPFQMVLNKHVAGALQNRLNKDFPNVLLKHLVRVREGF